MANTKADRKNVTRNRKAIRRTKYTVRELDVDNLRLALARKA